MLNYTLVKNKFGEGFTFIAYSSRTLTLDILVDRIVKKGTTLTKTDILAAINSVNEEVADAVAHGEDVITPLFHAHFSISGVAESALDSFDGSRNKLNLNLTKGSLLREAEKKVKLEKVNTMMPMPQILEVMDFKSGTANERLTPDGVVEARGFNLKIEGDDPSCGLWFVSENGQQQVKAEIFIENKPSKVTAFIPNLRQGKWQLKVVTQFSGYQTWLKTPKTYVCPIDLEVI